MTRKELYDIHTQDLIHKYNRLHRRRSAVPKLMKPAMVPRMSNDLGQMLRELQLRALTEGSSILSTVHT